MLMFVLAKPLLGWLYAHRFPESVPVLMLLSWFFALECLSFSLGDVLTTTNRQWQRTWVQGIAALGNVLINLVLIPKYGIYGASIATLLTELFVFAAYFWVVRRNVYRIRLLRQLPNIVVATLVMALAAYLLRNLHPLISAAAAGIVYLLLLIGLDRDFRRIGTYVQQRGLRLVKLRS